MKPLYLSIKGLFSYRKEAEIDFTPLTDAGLFGIFGPVGSGKSSILDAMTLALYGESDRLNAKDNRNYNLMNLQSRDLYIRFRFIQNGVEYLFTVEANRNSKNYGDVRTLKRRGYRIENGGPVALHDDNKSYSAQEILGLSYDNFRRTIIIPQGRFQEFLQLKANDRRIMMKELFGLEKYDLKPPTSGLLQKAKETHSKVNGSLLELEDVSEQELKNTRAELRGAEDHTQELNSQREKAKAELEHYKRLEDLFTRYKSACSDLKVLEQQKEEFRQRTRRIEQYEECSRRFAAYLQAIKERIRHYRGVVEAEHQAVSVRKDLEKARDEAAQNLKKVTSRREEKSSIEALSSQLESLSEMKKVKIELNRIDAHIEELSGQDGKVQSALEKLRQERTNLQNRSTELEKETALFRQMGAISDWYSTKKGLEQKKADLHHQVEQFLQKGRQYTETLQKAGPELAQKIEQIEKLDAVSNAVSKDILGSGTKDVERNINSLTVELASVYREFDRILTEADIALTRMDGTSAGPGTKLSESPIQELPEDVNKFQESKLKKPDASPRLRRAFETAKQTVQSALQSVRQSVLFGETRKNIENLSRELQENQPCPLCGSYEHPSPAHMREDALFEKGPDREETEKYIQILEEIQGSLIQHETVCLSSLQDNSQLLDAVNGSFKSIWEIENKLSAHRESFIWDEFSPDEESSFLSAIEAAQKANSELDVIRDSLKAKEKEIEQLMEKEKELQTTLQSEQQQRAVQQHRVSEKESEIEDEHIQEYKDLQPEKLAEKAAELRSEIDRIEEEYQKAQQLLHEYEKELSSANATVQERRQQRASAVHEISDSAQGAAEQLLSSGYGSLRTVREILSEAIDVQKERKEIEAFNNRYSAAEQKVAELESQTSDIDYSEELHQAAWEELEKLEQQYSEHLENKAVLQHKVESLEKRLQRKQELERENEQLEIRIENLNELFKLFKGQGFVNFVATRYLHDLCARANERFFHLTHKQLRLEINADNEFVIRDYLNGGRVRSVKTLSGGQLFQASFSLALALADSIHQNKESFFFLDEGFGSLDRRSLQDVFDTLKSLRKENRIVGVISHVEELREEIPVSLQVSEDPEAGSRIVSSI